MTIPDAHEVDPMRGLVVLTGGAVLAPLLFLAFLMAVPIVNAEPRYIVFLGVFLPGAFILVFMTDFSHGFYGKKGRHDVVQRSRVDR